MSIRSLFIVTCICIFAAIQSPALGEDNTYTYQVAQKYSPSTMGVLVSPKDSQDQYVALPATAGKFHWYTIDLNHTFTPGRYKIEYSLYSPGEGSPGIAIYTVAAGDQQSQITQICGAAPGETGGGGGYFFATAPFSKLAVKKMADGDAPTQAVGKITIIDTLQKEYPRLAGYRRLMQYPGAWNLNSPVIVEKLKHATDSVAEHFDVTLADLADVEKWLDLRSDAADVCCRADYLLRAAKLKHIDAQQQIEAVQENLKSLRDELAQNRLAEADASLKQLRTSAANLQVTLETKLGGTILPEVGTDIFTWLKAWELVGVAGGFEYSEPTPFITNTLTVGEPIDFTSTWTSNTYRSANITARYSILTPLQSFDVKQGAIHFDFTRGKFQLAGDADATRAKGYITLESQNEVLLVVFSRRPKDVQWANNALNIEFPDGGAIGYVHLPRKVLQKKNTLRELAKFYQRLLCKQPVECVQVQKGNVVEQTFEYVERQCDWPIKPLTIAPLPQLATLSREPSSKYHVKPTQPTMRSPDGWAYVNQSDTLSYEIPAIKRFDNLGINHYENCGQEKDYGVLRKQGCQYVRLICGATGSNLTEETRDELKTRVQKNLQWARDAGLKVSIDAHGSGWLPEGLCGEKGYSDPKVLEAFVNNWKMFIEWCQPYKDVIAWYDLANEPGIYYERESVKPYADFMRKAVAQLRPLAGDTPIMVECVNMANPVGLNFWEDLGDDNIVVGFHDYWPHMFTHQRAVEPGDLATPAVHFPSWMPMISWVAPSWNNDNPEWYYWDRWKCDSICLPVYRMVITKGYRIDCGEYGVTGYSGDSSPRSGVLWMRQAAERYRRLGISHAVYGMCGGYTWHIPAIKEEVVRFWNEPIPATNTNK